MRASTSFIFWWSHCVQVYDMFKHCNIERPPHAIYYFSKYTYYLPPSTPFIFYNPHPNLSLALALALFLSLSRGRVCWLRSHLRLLLYVIVQCCRRPLSLCLSLFINGHNYHYTHDLNIPPSHNSIALNCSSNYKT